MSNQDGTSVAVPQEELSNKEGKRAVVPQKEQSNQERKRAAVQELSNNDGTKAMLEELSTQEGTRAVVPQEELSNQDGKKAMLKELSNQEGTSAVVPQEDLSNQEGTKAVVGTKVMVEELSNQDGTKAIAKELSKIIPNLEKLIDISKGVCQQAAEPPKPPLYSLLGKDINPNNSTIYKAAIRNDWASALDIFDKDKEKLKVKLSPSGDTALHIAVGTNSSHDFVEKIVQMLIEKFLYVCIKSGHYDVALYLIKKYPKLVWEDCGGATPLMTLALKPDAFCSGLCLRYTEYYWFYEFIYSCIRISGDDESLSYKMPDTSEVTENNANNVHSSEIVVLPTAEPVWKVYFNNLKRWTVVPLRGVFFLIRFLLTVSNLLPGGSFVSFLKGVCRYLLWIVTYLLSVCYRILVYPIVILARVFKKVKCIIKEVHDEKLKHRRTELLVTEICSTLLEKLPTDINVYDVLRPAIFTAIKNGCIELLEKCIEEYPGTIWCTGSEYSFVVLAIKYRQEKVFNLIYQMSAYKIHMLNPRDNLQNALHAAGELPLYNRLNTVSGPALQLQRELLWFQKVEEFSETSSLYFRNKKNMIPKELFTEQHKGLLREAQEWTKATTASSTVVAALIVTITFAAMFTAPGGYEGDGDDDKGTPVFLRRKLFQIFVFTDTAGLFFSATSVLSFLSTLTCLSQEDFLSAVPWRLTIGFISLHISLVSTVVAFGATLVLVLYSKFHWINTMVITVGCLPIILNSWWQFPLFLELLRGTVWLTFGKSIFHKQKDLLIH